MGEWSVLSDLFGNLQSQSPMLGRFWLLLVLVFRILILGTVASDLFDDEQEEFTCNTLQPGCKQVCYDAAFPISQYRFWVFHIVLIATPSLVYLMYTMHHHNKRSNPPEFSRENGEACHLRRLYIINVAFRIVAEIGFLVGQWFLYGFKVEAQFPCNRFPCPYTVDCFTSRPAEKTIFLCFYFAIGVISAISSLLELFSSSRKLLWLSQENFPPERLCVCQNLQNLKKEVAVEEKAGGKTVPHRASGSLRLKGGSVRSSARRKISGIGLRHSSGKSVSSGTLIV